VHNHDQNDSEKPSGDPRLGKNGPGRNAGEEHAGTQGCLRQEALSGPPSTVPRPPRLRAEVMLLRRPVRLRLASLAFGKASSASRGKIR